MNKIEAFHGTIYQITDWRLPTGAERSSRGPAAICLTPDRAVAKGYCNAADGGTEEIARLIPQLNDARIEGDAAVIADRRAELDRAEGDWLAGRAVRREFVYRATISPRNALRLDAGGRKFWNITGEPGRDQDIWVFAANAVAAGHDCLIVDNVVDNGSVGMDIAATTIMVFDPAILSKPELVEEEALTFQQVCARTDARLNA